MALLVFETIKDLKGLSAEEMTAYAIVAADLQKAASALQWVDPSRKT